MTCGLCPSSNNPDQFLITTDGGRVMLTYDWVMIDNNGDQVIDVMSNLRLKIIVEQLVELVQVQLQGLLQPSHSI